MPPRLTSSLDFFLGDPYKTFVYGTNEAKPFNRSTIRGVRTITKYNIQLEGKFASFTVKFRPGGMYRLLGIPMHFLVNQDIATSDLDILPTEMIIGQLMQAADMESCIKIVEPHLLRLIQTQKCISTFCENSKALELFLKSDSGLKDLSETINLSVRQTERCFIKEVGIGPKLYQSLSRLTQLIQLKQIDPSKSWTNLSYEAAFYDQAHMIKTFKSFLHTTPKQFNVSNYAF